MKVHITNLYGHSNSSIALMAQHMVVNIARDMGFRELGLYAYPVETDTQKELSKRLDGVFASVSTGDIVIVQSPSWNQLEFDEAVVNKLKVYSKLKLAIFIHDVIPLMFKENFSLMNRMIAIYNKADVLIVPSQKMLAELYKQGLSVQKIIIQQMWDCPTNLVLDKPTFTKTINFTGNPERFEFVKSWAYSNPLRLFSMAKLNTNELNVILENWRTNEELLIDLAKYGGFGLVWSQSSDFNYYELNVSYKLANYIAAGLPVIVPNTLSNHHIIKDNKIGIVVSSLEEANHIISTMTTEEYDKLVDNVSRYRQLITQGYYTKKVLIDTVHALLTV